MKKAVLFVISLFFTVSTFAGQPDKIYFKLVEVSGYGAEMAAPYVEEYVGLLDEYLEENNLKVTMTDEKNKKIHAIAKAFFTSDKFLTFMSKAYESTFSTKEATELVAFFNTKTGQAFMQKNPQLLSEIEAGKGTLYEKFSEEISEVYLSDLK